jgi:4-diphosphocytidyl-2-C-methyl-D-erythritol kinase
LPALLEKARAKINLTLHVRGRRADGWHDLESLVAFAGVADVLRLEPQAALALRVSGPTAQDAGPDDDNLVLRAARAFLARFPAARAGRFDLVKRLPAQAGVGGGSSDAAAALRLLARLNDMRLDDPALHELAAGLGADVAVCLEPRARMMRGRGEELGPRLRLPPLYVALVRPGVGLDTAQVFRAMGYAPGEASPFGPHPEISDGGGFEELVAALRRGRNDMEDAACALAPAVSAALAVLAAAPGARLARMSGSGSTCFALFADRRAALRAAAAIRRARPHWWARASALA